MSFKSPSRRETLLRRPEAFQTRALGQVILVAAIAASGLLSLLLTGSGGIVCLTVCISSVMAAIVLWYLVKTRNDSISRTIKIYQQELNQFHNNALNLKQDAMQATTALSKMRDGVIMLSESHEILLINPAARILLNLDREQNYIGRTLEEVVRLPDVTRAVAAATAGSDSQSVALDAASHGLPHPIQCTIDPVAQENMGRLLITLRDETEGRRVDEMRREFVANISHELKTPLAAIKGYAETVELAIQDDPNAAIHFMSQINSQCLRLERLVADMMQLARVQAGPEHLNFTTVHLEDVIAECLKSYRPIAESKDIDLVVTTHRDVTVHADADATLTIANNLIGNALHYTPSGGRVAVSCRETDDSWALVVADTGVGIAAEEQDRIFERFYRVEKSRGSASGGTGIGLSMVKNLVNTMGGVVRVRSEIGQGSVFEVLFPKVQ